MPNHNKEEFLNRLRTLLEEYAVNISFECSDSSDLNGVYDMRLAIFHKPDTKSFKEIEWFTTEYSTTLSAYDLKD